VASAAWANAATLVEGPDPMSGGAVVEVPRPEGHGYAGSLSGR
jgi:hypothetical protein